MRKTTILSLVSAVAVGVVIATIYIFHEQTPTNTVIEQPPVAIQPTPAERVSNDNPLAVATHEQFRMWVPRFPIPCNEIIYIAPQPEHTEYTFCINLVIDRVADATNTRLTQEDVLDQKVKARWAEVMGG